MANSMSERALTGDTWWLLITFTGANAATAVANIFVNLFIFVVSGQLTGLLWFDAAYFFSLTFVFYGAAGIFRNRTAMLPFRWGLVLTIAFYGLVLGMHQNASHWVVPLGLLLGVAQGVFWFGANLMTFDGVAPSSRIAFYGYSAAVNSVNGVLGPTIGAGIIALVPNLHGYLLVFALALGIYVAALIASSRVAAGPAMEIGPLHEPLTLLRDRRDWALTFKTVVVRGTREGTFGLAGVFLVYIATHQAWAVGIYGAMAALGRALTSLLVTRHVTRARRAKSIILGATGLTVAALLLLVSHRWPWVFAYGLLAALTMPLYTVPNASVPLDVMDRDPEIRRHRVSYILSREVALNVGRLASIGLLALALRWISGPMALISVLILTSAAQAWIGWAVRHLFAVPDGPISEEAHG